MRLVSSQILRFALASFALALADFAVADDKSSASKDDLHFYKHSVQPILAKNCFRCHSHTANKASGGLVVDSIEAMLAGGDSGPSVVPGKPEESLLVQAIRHDPDADYKMPPDKKLADDEIVLLTRWVTMGAPGPRSNKPVVKREKITDEDRAWWAFQPLREPTVPSVPKSGFVRNDIDRFVFDRLTREGLRPSPEADSRVLIRRVYFDLIGLPPSPEEADEFVKSFAGDGDRAYEALVDRLLDSPHYGERWARHWLDLVRYAESDGFRIDDYRPNAWRYRDYVIRSLNNDKPYDRFIREQLAGDEIASDDPDALTATAFLRHTIYEYNQRDVRTQWSDMLNDLTDVTGDVFLGLGMGCARCHDHKFDPILQQDYYRLQAFFTPFMPREDVPLATKEQQVEYQAALAKWEAATAEVRAKIEEIEAPRRASAEKGAIDKFPDDIQQMMRKPRAERAPLEDQLAQLAYRQVLYEFGRLETKMSGEEKVQLAALKRQLAEFDNLKPAPLPTGQTVTDVGPVAPLTVIPKKTNATPLEPGFPQVLDASQPAIPAAPHSTGRRTALANWLTRPDHPLTTRVIVNRIWQYHFGRGLVSTASDFGKLGEKPTHPELLDWLAVRFVKDGWSFKKMHRLILTSAAYRQSATVPQPNAVVKDPENRLLWRAATRRLDAEQIRDAILSITGELDLTVGGPSVATTTPRRTVYTRVTRNTRDPLLDVFDLPEGFTSTPLRNVTTTPTQSLLLFNSQALIQRAQALVKRIEKEKPAGEPGFVTAAYRLAYDRKPTSNELSAAVAFLKDQAARVDPEAMSGPGFYSERMPYREGQAALVQPASPQARLLVSDTLVVPRNQFTIEGFVLLRSLYDTGAVRVIASQWSGDKQRPGWVFGVTSKKSRFKPQTLVLQLLPGDGSDEPLFSGLHITLNKPYYVAATVNLDDTSRAGVTFYAKDLSNDDEPMLVASMEHRLRSLSDPGVGLVIGNGWDGLIDDVRISKIALPQERLLLTSEGVAQGTVAYWQFEPGPHPYYDATGGGHDLVHPGAITSRAKSRQSALVDFCHVLLNSNEFLYVD
jgi:hypothetical protein